VWRLCAVGLCVAGDLGTVVFLHGFPEIWYSWRHQMLAVAAAGYRAIAPDCRGYGLSDLPPEHEEVSFDDLVADVLGILDALSVPKVKQQLTKRKYLPCPTATDQPCHTRRRSWWAKIGAPFWCTSSRCSTRTAIVAWCAWAPCP